MRNGVDSGREKPNIVRLHLQVSLGNKNRNIETTIAMHEKCCRAVKLTKGRACCVILGIKV